MRSRSTAHASSRTLTHTLTLTPRCHHTKGERPSHRPRHLHQLRNVFDRFDTDKSGFIDLDELDQDIDVGISLRTLHAAPATGGKRVTREETVKILADVDTNHDAKITFDEFESVFARASDALPPGLAQLVDVSKGLVDGLGGLVDGLAGFVVQGVKQMPMFSNDEHAIDALFAAIDADGSGSLDAQELLALVLSMGISELDAEAVNSLIREVDLNGDGEIQREEFAALLQARKPPRDAAPHLCLNFDVNMTVLMIDSAIGGDAAKILNMVLSNCVWGRVTSGLLGGQPSWALSSTTPSAMAPEPGLLTFAEYMMSITDVKGLTDVAKIKETKARRRKALQTFVSAGALGEKLLPQLNEMAAALRLPETVVAAAGPDALAQLGLENGLCGLLPSFLHMLRELKRSGRSFSVRAMPVRSFPAATRASLSPRPLDRAP